MNKKRNYFLSLLLSVLLATILTKYNSVLKIAPIFYVLYIIYKIYKENHNYFDFNSVGAKLFRAYCIYCIFLFFKSLLFDTNNGVLGNYYLSLIGNLEFGLLSLSIPVCALTIYENNFLNKFMAICDIIAFLGIIIGLFYLLGFNISEWCFVLYLLPFFCIRLAIKHDKTLLYWLFFIMSLLYCYIEDERSILIMNLFSIIALYICEIIKNKTFVKIVRIYVVFIPFAGIILTLYNLVNEESFFQMMFSLYGDKSTLVEDTRTFLFSELREDLTQTGTWMWGKGMFGTYYSEVMDTALSRGLEADAANRLGIECGYLWLILKGGIIYCTLYFLIFYFATIQAIKKNNFVFMIVAITISHRLLMMFVSYTPRMDIANIICWVLIGLCFSKRFTLSYENKND